MELNMSFTQRIASLMDRLDRLEKSSSLSPRHRDIVTLKGRKSIAQLFELAEEFLQIAKNKGFLRAKIQEDGDFPVVVLERDKYVFLRPTEYVFEVNGSSRSYQRWDEIISRLSQEQGAFGNEEAMMDASEIMPTTSEILRMLQGARDGDGFMGERWTLASDNGKTAEFKTGSETMSLSVTLTNRGIKFSLTGPYVKPNQPMATVNGFIREEGRAMQLQMLGYKLDEIVQKAGKRLRKTRMKALKELRLL
jgi:hypothetical protein